MRQVLQSAKDGKTWLAEVPTPALSRHNLLIRSSVSLISAGTERMLLQFGRANLVQKARQQPDKVKLVLEKARTDGVLATLESVSSKLEQPLQLGYCNVGTVLAAGSAVRDFRVGDRVVSNGKHAEVVSVPETLCARIPDEVPDASASFAVIGAIALQGVRLVEPTLGECVVVTGLGLVGLMTVQLLLANGCRVLGVDMDEDRLATARRLGAEVAEGRGESELLAAAQRFSRGRGVDAVIVTASTRSNEPIAHAARMCRKRGRIVLVGVTGLELSRADFYEKELTFQVSCSYGPGRYDPSYEEQGADYPVGFVRWTVQRNFEAVLDLMQRGVLDVEPLISHRFAISDAEQAYNVLLSGQPSLGIVLQYPPAEPRPANDRVVALVPPAKTRKSAGTVSFIGAGNYASRVLIPAFAKAGAKFRALTANGGVSAVHYGHKFGFAEASTDVASVLADPQADTVVIATRHDSHAKLTVDALQHGKHVFVEKPLCISLSELDSVGQAYRKAQADRPTPLLMVGFNRRFAPHTVKMKELLARVNEPKAFIVTVNAGAVPPDSWVQDPAVGGGRIIGEACHFIDLVRFLCGSPTTHYDAVTIGGLPADGVRSDKAVLSLTFADGSIGTVHYLANGHRGFPKERVEVFCDSRVLTLDNFVSLSGYGWPGFSKLRLWRQDKGQRACAKAFLAAVRAGGPSPIPFDEIEEVSRIAIELGMRTEAT